MDKVETGNIQDTIETAVKTVSDLTIPEFKQIIREVVQELLWDLEANMPDPDEGLELKPEVAERLKKALETPVEELQGKPLEELMQELGIDE